MSSFLREPLLDKFGVSVAHGEDSPVVGAEYGFLRYTWPWQHGHRFFLAILLFVGLCLWLGEPLVNLFAMASDNEHFSHLLLVPVLSFYLLYSNRAAILSSRKWSPLIGLLIMASGAVCYWLAEGEDGTQDRLTVEILAFVVMCWGLFLFSFGDESFRRSLFALVMLVFLVPLPTVILDALIGFLQRSSAEVTALLFSVLHVPVLREGFVFSLSNFAIYVAEECSGLRSFFALVITSLVAGHWFLTSGWSKTALVVVVVPLAIIKNAVRIVGLTLLANYIDPTFITDSALHRSGGIPLFLFSLVVLLGIVLILQRWESRLTVRGGSVRDGHA
jgi:exosortase